MVVQAPLSLSWVGSSCLCRQDAERELIAMREQVILGEGALKSTTHSGGAEKQSGEPYRWRRYFHPPSRRPRHPRPNAITLPEKNRCSTPSTKHSSDEAIVQIQEETEALRQALADKSDYRLAQCSMNRLDDLESALWEAHATETRAAAQLETLALQREQKAEEEALEADLKEKVDRLREACGQRAFTLRREHAKELDKLVRVARGGGGGGGAYATTPGPPTPCATQSVQLPAAATPSLVSINQHQTKWKTEPTDTTEEEQDQEEQTRKQEQEQERGEEGGGLYVSRQPTPFVLMAVEEASAPEPVLVPVLEPGVRAGLAHQARKKEMVDLREELGRHLAVAHTDGGRHLKEATRVMRLIEEVEAQTKLEAEAKATSKHDSLEKIFLQQKHAQAEDVQQEKHEKLLRALERSRAEQLRLVSARHNGALGRLAERRRETNRRRKHELRKRLAVAKSGVARAWKEHNRCLLGAGVSSEKLLAARENRDPLLEKPAAAATAAAAAATAAPEVTAAVVPKRGTVLTSMEPTALKVGRRGGRSATHSSCLVEITAAGAAEAAEAAVHVGNQSKMDASRTLIDNTAPSIVVERVTTWDTSVQTKQKPRRAAILSLTAPNTFPNGSSSHNRGPPRRQRRKRRVTSNTTNDDAPELSTTSPTLATAFVSGAAGVLSEEEVQALAALGRGTPNDPRLLLITSHPPSPSGVDVVEERDATRTARDKCRNINCHALLTTRDDNGKKNSHQTLRMVRDDCGKDSYYHSDGSGHVVETIRGRGNSVLERAVDKLVPEMRAREDLTRRSFGLASLASW